MRKVAASAGVSVALIVLLGLLQLGIVNRVCAAEVFYSGNSSSNKVALTFDDGPNPLATPKIIQILDALNVKATFFMVGINIAYFPNIIWQAIRSGHEIGNHTAHHFSLTKLSLSTVENELQGVQRLVYQLFGFKPEVFRPPYGQTTSAINAIAHDLGLKVILWTVDPADWKNPPPAVIAERVLSGVKSGAIVVMHDRINTALALPIIIPALKASGYQLVTVSELLAESK